MLRLSASVLLPSARKLASNRICELTANGRQRLPYHLSPLAAIDSATAIEYRQLQLFQRQAVIPRPELRR